MRHFEKKIQKTLFQGSLDALSSIELVADKAIRETVQQAGLNSAEVTVPAQSYGLSQPLHRIWHLYLHKHQNLALQDTTEPGFVILKEEHPLCS